MHLITIDFETYYDKDYSLSKLTTEEYLRDPRFSVIGVSTKLDDEPAVWVTGPPAVILEHLRALPWNDAMALGHNMMFDGGILSWRCGIRPKALADTLSMSRARYGVAERHSLKELAKRCGAGEKGTEVENAKGLRRKDFSPEQMARYGAYCRGDVDLTHFCFMHMLREGFPQEELRLIDLTLRMFTEPVIELDGAHLRKHLHVVRQRKEDLLAAAGVTDKKDLMSNNKFADMLRTHGVEPPTKTSPTTGKETFAFAKTDEAFLELEDHPNPAVSTLVSARLGNKSTLEETRTERFIGIARRGALPVPVRYYAAHTGRWGGCLVGDTAVTVFDRVSGICQKRIVDVLKDDLVWDGVEFVAHDGVVFSGYAEVIEWDGVRGTEDHVVFTDAGEISLRAAKEGGHHIQVGSCPDEHAVDAARRRARKYEV